jgi:hypothetical protein
MHDILPNTYYTDKESAVKHLFEFSFTIFFYLILILKSVRASHRAKPYLPLLRSYWATGAMYLFLFKDFIVSQLEVLITMLSAYLKKEQP